MLKLRLQFARHQFLYGRPGVLGFVQDLVHLVNDYCGGTYGFVSSHASNTFAVAVFTGLFLRNRYYWIGILFWASLVGYSRIYLGVHFPGDIIGGAMLGSLLAWGWHGIMTSIRALKLNH